MTDPREDDNFMMGSLAAQDAYRGEYPNWPTSTSYPPPRFPDAGGAALNAIQGFLKRHIDQSVGLPSRVVTPPPTGWPEGSEEDQHIKNVRQDEAANWARNNAMAVVFDPFAVYGKTGAVGVGPTRPPRVSIRPTPANRRMGDLAAEPPPPMGHNAPPEEFRLGAEDMAPPSSAQPMGALAETVSPILPPTPPSAPAAAPPSWNAGLPRPQPAATSTAIPNIRGLPLQDAIDIARTMPHLIKAGDQSEGGYVGGPRDIQTKRQLSALRNRFDEYIKADPRGMDWYDRYRPALNLSTGGVPEQNQMAAAQHGQWSAGVDPGSELHYVLKELNSSIAGVPERANYGAQHRAHLNAVAANDPTLYQLADKTDEYREQISKGLPGGSPIPRGGGGTGVNDFRYARQWEFREPGGEPQKGALTSAQHKFIDQETALAVDRANREMWGGRNDWTGEKLQAAPWVRQKALDLMSRNSKLTYPEAFARANRTIADYYPSKTYNATHEAQPGANVVDHMSQSSAANNAERQAYFDDPRSRWSTGPLPEGVTGPGRDAIYAGLGTPGTGNFMRVLPTRQMTGVYKRPDGVTEINPGEVAQPMGTFSTPPEVDKDFIGPQPFVPFKRAAEGDRMLLDAGEALRAYVDAQNAGSWNKTWPGGPANQSNSLVYPDKVGKADPALIAALQARNAQHGLPDVADTGAGVLSTQWWPTPKGGKAFDKAFRKGEMLGPGGEVPERVRVDSGLIEYAGKDLNRWETEGSGEASRHMLSYITKTPELRAAFNNNPYIAERALAKFERDKDWAPKWGAPRQDIQNARELIGAGPGWIDRMEKALKDGSISLPAFAALMAGAASLSRGGNRGGQNDKL